MSILTGLGISELNTRIRSCVVANPDSCVGCRSCETVCSLVKIGRIQPEMARLRIERDAFKGVFIPHVCHQCSIPQCLKACPEEAIGIFPKTGAVVIDRKKCTGCGECAMACPYAMIVFDPDENKYVKCNLCNGQPNCVGICPANALGVAQFGLRS